MVVSNGLTKGSAIGNDKQQVITMDLGILLTVGILALDFVLSIWNSYAAGYNFGMLRKQDSNFGLIYAIFALMMGVVGLIYVIAIAIGFALYAIGSISLDVVNLLLAYNFLVFGGLITFLGVGITIQTWMIAIKTHNKWAIGASIWNTFASIWNVFNYISEFSTMTGIIKSESKDTKDEGSVIIIIIVAVIIALLLSYVAFHAGNSKAKKE